MQFSFAKIIRRSPPNRSVPILLVLLAVLFSGCTERKPPTIPSAVVEDLYILDTDQTFLAGARLSEVYRTVVSELEEHVQIDGQTLTDLNEELFEELGIDAESHDVTIYGSYDIKDGSAIPSLLIRAPIPEQILSELEARSTPVSGAVNRIGTQGKTANQTDELADADALFFTRLADGLLAVSGAVSQLESMTERVDEANGTLKQGLLPLVAGADLWFVLNQLTQISQSLDGTALPEELTRVVASISSVAVSVEIEGETTWISMFLRPNSGIDRRDISDLIRGGIALLKLQIEDQSDFSRVLIEFLERIDVSEHDDFSRVQISIRESDIDELASSIKSVLSRLDLPS